MFTRSLTIDHAQVPSGQTDFPVLVWFTDATLKTIAYGGHVQRSDGFDVGFFGDALGMTPLKWEIERYTPVTGELVAWVKIPSVASGGDTVFFLRYGDPSITTDQSDPVNVWTNNFLGVYHLKDGTTLSVADSRNVNNGTNHGATPVAGQIDGGAAFAAASSQYIDCGTGFHNSAMTYSGWVNAASLPNAYNCPFGRSDGTDRFVVEVKSNGKLYVSAFVGSGTYREYDGTGSHTLSTGTWYYVAAAFDNVGGLNVYVNAESDHAAIASPQALFASIIATDIGQDPGVAVRFWDGGVDEVRISSVRRYADWITCEYNNQKAASTFVRVGNEVAPGPLIAFVQVSLKAGAVSPNDVILRTGAIVSATGSSAGVSVVSGAGSVVLDGAASSSGTGTVSGTGKAIWDSLGASAGTGAASGIGKAVWDVAAASVGIASASGVSSSRAGVVGASSGVGSASGSGKSIWDSVGASAGVAVPSGVGRAIRDSAAASNGTCTVSAASDAIRGSAASSSGIAVVGGVGKAIWDSAAVSSGTCSVSGAGKAIRDSVGASAGVGAVAGVGRAVRDSAASSSGVAAAMAAANALWDSLASATGTSIAVASTSDYVEADGSSSGVCVITGRANSTKGASGISAGISAVNGNVSAVWDVTASAAGIATAVANSSVYVGADGSAAGLATAGAGSFFFVVAGCSSSGTCTVTGDGDAAEPGSTASSHGTASALGASAFIFNAVGLAAGTAVASATSSVYVAADGSVDGICVVTSDGSSSVYVAADGSVSGIAIASCDSAIVSTRSVLAHGTCLVMGESNVIIDLLFVYAGEAFGSNLLAASAVSNLEVEDAEDNLEYEVADVG